MKITLEQIDFLRERAEVSYKEAKEALEETDGDMVEALVLLEKQNKVNKKKKTGGSKSEGPGFMDNMKRFFRKMNRIRFILKNDRSTLLNFPMTLALVLAIFATPFVVIGLIIALFAGYRVQFKNESGEDMAVNKYFDKVSDTVQSMTDSSKSE